MAKKGSKKTSKIQLRLEALEKEIKGRGVSIGYERLQYAGLILNSGLCWFRGRYYLFVDRRKKVRQRIELLEGVLEELDRLAAEGRLDRPLDETPQTPPESEEDTQTQNLDPEPEPAPREESA